MDQVLMMFAIFALLLVAGMAAVLAVHMRERRAFFDYQRQRARREADEALAGWLKQVDEEIRMNG